MRHTPQAHAPAARRYHVYLLECRGGRLYSGIATDVDRRLAEHRSGKRGARFTRAYPPVKLLASIEAGSRSEALKLEAALKKLPRTGKLEWAARAAVPSFTARETARPPGPLRRTLG